MPSGGWNVAPQPNGGFAVTGQVRFDWGDVSQTMSCPVKAGTWVPKDGACVVVPEEFDGSGAEFEIGISYDNANNVQGNALVDDDDALLNGTSSAIGTQSDPTTSDGGGAEPKVAGNSEVGLNGWWFESDGAITFKFAPGTSATKGELIGIVALFPGGKSMGMSFTAPA